MDVLLVALDDNLAEIRALLASAGHRVVGEIVQLRDRPDPQTFVGRGKLEDVRLRVGQGDAQVVVFNGELRPTMHYRLERTLGLECYDRLRVLLELFAQRAATREAKLQVELALLHYEVPLLREWIHRADAGERPGFMAGGEYRVDAYYETVKRRIKRIRDELEGVERERELRRSVRKDRGFGLVAIAGYANAGKSSLLNALTGEHVLVENRMFSTLSTTTRALHAPKPRILLTDTVGFVDGVPFWMVDAFRATLEEILQAEMVLLLIDASDSHAEILRKVRLAGRTLLPRVREGAILPILTKTDLVEGLVLQDKIRLLEESEFHRAPLAISTRSGRGLDELRDAILASFAYPIEMRLILRHDATVPGKLHRIHEHAEVLATLHRSEEIEVLFRCRERDREALESLGRVVEVRETFSP